MGDDDHLKATDEFVTDAAVWDLLPLLEQVCAGQDGAVEVVHAAQLERGACEVVGVDARAGGKLSIRQHAFGLVDSASPLPEAYVDLAIREANSEVGGPWLDLLNAVSEPFVLSDWRAWRRRFLGIAAGHALPDATHALGRSCGDEAVQNALAAAGYFAHGVFSCGVLSTAVSSLLDADCRVEEFEPEWISIDASDCPRLGVDLCLGGGLLGTRALTVDGAATLRIKAGNWDDVGELLRDPRDSRLGRLLALASEGRISWTVELSSLRIPASTRSTRAPDEPQMEILLGVSSWLTSNLNMPGDYNCSVRIPQCGAWKGD